MFGLILTEEQRIEKAVVSIMAHPKWCAYAGMLMMGKRIVSDDNERYPTACTNGRDEWYGRKFVASLTDAELRFLILHEVCHKMFRHLITWAAIHKINAKKANLACDFVINVLLVDADDGEGFITMTGALTTGCFNVKYRNWDSGQVFHDLPDPIKRDPEDGDGDGGMGKPIQGDGDADDDDAGGSIKNDQPYDGTYPVDDDPSFDDHDWDGAEDMTPDEQRDLAREVDEAVRSGALAAGKMGNGADRNITELLQPQIDYTEYMAEFFTSHVRGKDFGTFKRPNKRYLSAGVYMPSLMSNAIGPVCLAMDMSGSIGQREQSVMLTECGHILSTLKPECVHVLYWDTTVVRAEKYERDELDMMIKSTKPAGGGGTDVRCVPAYLKEHRIKPEATVILTDGHLWGGCGEWGHPTLWVTLDHAGWEADVGKTVHVRACDM